MDLNLFATQLTDAGKTGKTALSGNQPLGGNGGLSIGGAAFWDVILGNLTAEENAIKAENENKQDNLSSEELKKEKVDLALLQLALLGQDPDQPLEDKLADLKIEKIIQTQENRVVQLTKIIDHLTNGLPQQAQASGSIEELVQRLEKRLEKLEASLESFRSGDFGDEGAPFQLLIATGIDPNKLTKITTRIEQVETKLGRKLTAEDLIAGVGNIIPVPGDNKQEDNFSIADYLGLLTRPEQQNTIGKGNLENQETLTKNHNKNTPDISDTPGIPGIPGSRPPQTEQSHEQNIETNELINFIASSNIAPAGTQTAALEPTTSGDGGTTEEAIIPLSEQRMTNADFKALFGKANVTKSGLKPSAIPQANATATPALANTSNTPAANNSPAFALPANFSSIDALNNILSEALGFDVQTGTPFSNTMQAVHTASATPQAGQNHPATQMVAAHITKAAQNSDTRNITLQLDPPELGRVEVRLEFGKDKTVKANLIVEKPETYLMLQRDAAALERALQNAGLETAGDSVNYQMADDQYGFNTGNGNQNGQNGNGHSGTAGAEAEETVIETTMSWSVDEATGHVHYSLLA